MLGKKMTRIGFTFVTDRSKAVLLLWIIYVVSVLFCYAFHARLFDDALWSPAGKLLTSLFSFMMSNCDVKTFPLVSWVRSEIERFDREVNIEHKLEGTKIAP